MERIVVEHHPVVGRGRPRRQATTSQHRGNRQRERDQPNGRLHVYVNRLAALPDEIPPGPVTVTSIVPLPGGLTAAISVSDLTVNAAGVPPMTTEVTPVKPEPLIDSAVPPATGPEAGDNPATVGVSSHV